MQSECRDLTGNIAPTDNPVGPSNDGRIGKIAVGPMPSGPLQLLVQSRVADFVQGCIMGGFPYHSPARRQKA